MLGMLKAFFRDGAVYGLAKLLTGGLTVVSLPIYTHALAPGEYGVVDLLTSLATIVHVTVALEISQGLGRHVMAPEAAAIRERYVSTALWFTMAAYSLFLGGVMPFATTLSVRLFATVAHAGVIRLAALVAWTTGVFNLLQGVLRYSRRAPKYAAVSVAFSTTNVAVTVVLLLVVHAGLAAMFTGQFVAGLCAVALAFTFTRDLVRPTFDAARCREMLAFSAPLVPSGVGLMLCMYADRFAVLRLLSVGDVGMYGVAFRIASVVAIAVAGFDAALAPLIYQHHAADDTPAQLARTLRWFLALALPLLVLLGLFADVLVRLAAPPTYAPAAKLVLPLSASMLVANLYNFSPGLWIAKRTGWVAVISLGAGLLNLGLNFLLIPRVGLVGAALATLLSALAACAAHVFFGQALYRVPFAWPRLAAGTSLLGLVFVVDAITSSGAASFFVRAAAWVLISATCSAILLGPHDRAHIRRQLFELLRTRQTLAEPSLPQNVNR